MIAEAIALLTLGAVVAAALMSVFWIIQLIIKNAGVVDIGWALSLCVLTGIYASMATGYLPRRLMILLFVSVWALRLSGLIVWRILKTRQEDKRYQALRADWAPHIQVKFFLLFQAEAVLALVLSVSFLVICLNSRAGFVLIEHIGIGLWDIAFLGEIIADEQLRRFKSDPANRGQVCRAGLWKYSRHPNYFFEWMMWVAYAVFALGSPYGWIGALSPGIMLFLLLKVTGVPFAEMMALRSKGDRYREYQRVTSVFFPWPPQKA